MRYTQPPVNLVLARMNSHLHRYSLSSLFHSVASYRTSEKENNTKVYVKQLWF